MATETERKFLVRRDAWDAAPKPPGRRLRQGYLADDPERTVRVRLAEGAAWLTIKGRAVGLSRPEFEYAIPPDDAREMLDRLAHAELDKTRFRVPVGAHVWDVDVFHGRLDGLVVAEVELERADEPFERPAWLGDEVSDDARYFNSALARADGPPA